MVLTVQTGQTSDELPTASAVPCFKSGAGLFQVYEFMYKDVRQVDFGPVW
jgi:hypothetical protein